MLKDTNEQIMLKDMNDQLSTYYDKKGLKRNYNGKLLKVPENISQLPIWRIMLLDFIPVLKRIKNQIVESIITFISFLLNFITAIIYLILIPFVLFNSASRHKKQSKKIVKE